MRILVVKRLLLTILIAILLISTSILCNNGILETTATTSFLNYELYSNGGGSTSSIHWDGAKFTLTTDLEGTITLMSDDIVLDGADHTVTGKGDAIGIAVYDKTNVEIRNVKTGILLGHYSPDAFL